MSKVLLAGTSVCVVCYSGMTGRLKIGMTAVAKPVDDGKRRNIREQLGEEQRKNHFGKFSLTLVQHARGCKKNTELVKDIQGWDKEEQFVKDSFRFVLFSRPLCRVRF